VSPLRSRGLFLVLASRRAFESFAGPIPDTLKALFRFQKPRNAARIRALLPDCRLVISKSYTRPQSNHWIFEARRLGIPTLLLIDGPLEWANLYANPSLARLGESGATGLYEPIIHDAVATIGNAQTQWIEARNAGRGIELMSYANRRIQTRQTQTQGESTGPDRDCEFDFLVTTARTPYFDAREKADLSAMLAACGAALVNGGHRTLVRIYDEDLRESIRSTAPSFTFETQSRFAEALSRSRCVIGTPSSVLLEAMQHDKPTGLLMFRDSPLFYQTGWLLGCSDDWGTSFVSMLGRDPNRMQRQQQSLRENISDQDFFTHCKKISDGELLAAPRPLDSLDLEFENRVLRTMLGWRSALGRLLGVIRKLS
jgi:hypothetical protein